MSKSIFFLQNLAAVYHTTVCKSSNHKFLCIQEASLGFQECLHLSMNKLHLTLYDCILCKPGENYSTITVNTGISLSGIGFLMSTCVTYLCRFFWQQYGTGLSFPSSKMFLEFIVWSTAWYSSIQILTWNLYLYLYLYLHITDIFRKFIVNTIRDEQTISRITTDSQYFYCCIKWRKLKQRVFPSNMSKDIYWNFILKYY